MNMLGEMFSGRAKLSLASYPGLPMLLSLGLGTRLSFPHAQPPLNSSNLYIMFHDSLELDPTSHSTGSWGRSKGN